MRVDHPVLGDLTLSLRGCQYVGWRTLGAPAVLRLDLASDSPVTDVERLLDARGAQLEKLESQFDAALTWTSTVLEQWRKSRGTASAARLQTNMVLLLADVAAAVLFDDAVRADKENASAWFDAARDLQRAQISTDQGATERFPVPTAVPRSERVHHAKFGPVEVVATIAGDKVTVRFDDGSERILLRTFLRTTSY